MYLKVVSYSAIVTVIYLNGYPADSLFLHLQFVHDGHLSDWLGQYDPHEDSEEGLRSIQQRGGAV